ncbi:HAUS augmin-like complex subunit 1 [Anas platyrhynchos]|uniref:HAUS augmin like complex subunit 1 n=2 Tax=Anas platyrhynchos TaxID=8839 RepID=U3IUS3_ANAPP|nr:HAUS augmin-like complex subunit 1 [Anas platyrhynchos]|eukprot:XP_027302654.1 LOW QUALITY PROTEIN: HAUS augmin-like complex subunit 1 [Anas platyrhynchos]
MAEADTMEKLRQVTLWLKEVFENQPIPHYEVNPQTVEILYNLKEYSETRERDLAFLVEDTEQKAAEYEAQAKYLEDLLTKGLGLSLSSLSSEGATYLNTLVNSAITLGTKDTSLASFFCAINDMSSELYATESKNKELELELASMNKKLTAALAMEKRLEEDLRKTRDYLEVERVKAESRSQNLKFLRDKSEDFKIRIKAAEEKLAANGLDYSLMHQSLVSMSEKLEEMQKEVVPVKRELDSYLDLTPNPSLVQVKVEEARRELNDLEAELSKEILMLTLEMPESRKNKFT